MAARLWRTTRRRVSSSLDDLLRIDARNPDWWGWIYAYLRAPTVRKMMKAAEYGHIIKHLEAHHLDSLPIVCVSDAIKR